MTKEIAILGAGISGLSLAWFLKKKWGDQIHITLFEKSSKVGGWIQTQNKGGFLFENGPRSCRIRGNGWATLHLIQDLNLNHEIITADLTSNKRFLFQNNTLVPLPQGLLSLFFSPFVKTLAKGFWHDWWAPRGKDQDESIYDFTTRRLNSTIANQLIDPMVSGIYAGNIRELSLRSCFPSFYEWEQAQGGLIKGMLFQKAPLKKHPLSKHTIFSLKEGMGNLCKEIAKQLDVNILLNTEALSIKKAGHKVDIHFLNKGVYDADHVFSTLPSFILSQLIKDSSLKSAEILDSIPYASLAVVNVGYKEDVLKRKGFGYLIPSNEKQEALGVVWNSSIFPQQQPENHTSLTVMLGGMHRPDIPLLKEEQIFKKALEILNKHLNITQEPIASEINISKFAIPQFLVGHQKKLDCLNEILSKDIPFITLHGSYFGVSVNDCIAKSKLLSHSSSF